MCKRRTDVSSRRAAAAVRLCCRSIAYPPAPILAHRTDVPGAARLRHSGGRAGLRAPLQSAPRFCMMTRPSSFAFPRKCKEFRGCSGFVCSAGKGRVTGVATNKELEIARARFDAINSPAMSSAASAEHTAALQAQLEQERAPASCRSAASPVTRGALRLLALGGADLSAECFVSAAATPDPRPTRARRRARGWREIAPTSAGRRCCCGWLRTASACWPRSPAMAGRRRFSQRAATTSRRCAASWSLRGWRRCGRWRVTAAGRARTTPWSKGTC